jgi:predicted house-cleaning noncanonical NTP pyrophosphatase (MazG superfamily)
MNDNEERAFRYHQRAEELRATIPHTKDKACRETLVKIAEDYDYLAHVQEMLAEEKKRSC